jgi:beta-1,4-mannosyltransferase
LNQSDSSNRTGDKMRVLAWPIQSPSNPYTSLLYSQISRDVCVDEYSIKRILEQYSVWHVHWPEALLNIRNPAHAALKVAGFFAALGILQSRGAKLIWTVHNCHSHEKLHPSLEARFWRRFIPRVDGVVSLSSTGLSHALEAFPNLRDKPSSVIPHGHYRCEYPLRIDSAREMLGFSPEAKVVLFFGAVRAYKNVEGLVRAFRGVTTNSAVLQIVGQPNSTELARSISKEASSDGRVHVRFDFLESEILSAYLSSADLIVLPYREILNSGSALLAISLNRPILVPDLGAMSELKVDFGEDWVRTFTGELDARTLENALEWALESRPRLCAMPEKYEWRSIGDETLRFYRHVVSRKEIATAKPSFAATESTIQKA